MEVLTQGQVKVACVPLHVQAAIQTSPHTHLTFITPGLVSATFRSIQVCVRVSACVCVCVHVLNF